MDVVTLKNQESEGFNMKTNILVQYQGGGYNGCFWEWNYFYIDKWGIFHDIQSSGYAGVNNLQDAKRLIEDEANSTYIYNVDKDEDIIAFSKESHPVHVTGVLQWFEDYNDADIEFFAVCSECGCKMTACCDITLAGDMLLCSECFSTGECPCCESYVGDTEIVKVNPDEHYSHDYICADCKEYHDEEREAEEHEDLRFQTFCIGKPDIFSEEMRWFWN